MDEVCKEHSGCIKSIEALEESDVRQWDKLDKQEQRITGIFTRINIILGGIVVSCILLLVNLAVK